MADGVQAEPGSSQVPEAGKKIPVVKAGTYPHDPGTAPKGRFHT